MNHWSLHSGKFLTVEEDQVLLNRLNKDDSRDALMLLILRATGIRGHELRGLRIREFNPSRKTIFVRASKGSNDREIHLPADVSARLTRYVEITPPNIKGLLFPISRSRLSDIWRGFRPIGCGKGLHSLRHSFAVAAYKNTKDLLFVKAMLGHRSLASTMVYQEFAYTDEAFREYMATFWMKELKEVFLK